MKAVFYDKDLDGLWREITFAEGLLHEFSIDDNHNVVFSGNIVDELVVIAKDDLLRSQEAEKQRRIEAEKQRIEAERQQAEKFNCEEDFKYNMAFNFSQQEIQVRDADGNRWIKCEFCGKIAMEKEFNLYGGAGHINLGTCKECSANNLAVKENIKEQSVIIRKQFDPVICPECGGKLQKRSGLFGKFWGCSNYPKCRYSKSVRK